MSYTVLVLNYNILSIIPFPELFTNFRRSVIL